MAYQRPFLISLKRDFQEPWGFRTFGGKEYGEPHIVEKVSPDSVAEQCGIREGDEIIQIGRVNVQDCTFGQIQELLARSGNKIEMFVIREDLLSPRKGKEPSHVKAIVHNPYNSPLNLYSTENIAETLAKQTEVLTEGHISSAEEEDAPENLSFKEKSAVFQLLEEQAKQETVNQNFSRPRKAPPPPPPPKAPPSAAQYYQNKENYSPQDRVFNSVQPQQQQAYDQRDSEFYTRKSPTEHKREEQKVASFQSQKNVTFATTNHYTSEHQQTAEYKSSQRVTSTTPTQASVTAGQQHQRTQHHPESQDISFQQHREKQEAQQHWPTHQQQKPWQSNQQQEQLSQYQPQKQSTNFHSQQPPQQMQRQQQKHQHMQQQHNMQQQQQHHIQQQQQHHIQQQQQQHYHQIQQQQQQHHHQIQQQQQQQQQQQHQIQQQKQQQHQIQQQQQQHQMKQHQHHHRQPAQRCNMENDEKMQPTGSPIMYKAPPSQKPTVNWPPANTAQQNGRWHSPSPTPSSPSKNLVTAAWPPKQPTVKDLPKTGFNPGVIREQGSGRRCVWPPPKPDDEFRSGRSTPQSPVTGRRIAWNPSPSPPLTRRSPFGSSSPVTRRKDLAWPPAAGQKMENSHHRPSPTLTRKARFDDYVKLHASTNVPSTYRPPPGTQRVEYA